MRIGKFAETNKVSIDTIRHYMELGLLLPEKRGGQYTFDEKSQKKLEDIFELKNMGFTLGEIKNLFFFRKFGKLTPYEEDEYYKAFFMNKHKNVSKEIESLIEIKEKLEEKIQDLSQKIHRSKHNIGLDFRNLRLLKCPQCGESLALSKGSIENNQIIDGILKCQCGIEYVVESGIIMSDANLSSKINNQYPLDYVGEYIQETDESYLQNLYKGLESIRNKIDFKDLKGKVILELGTGSGFFLRNIYEDLPEDCVYIAVDRDINRQIFLKNILETANCKRNVIFVCTDFLEIPLEKNSIEVLIDISGSSNYAFENEKFLLKAVDQYVQREATLIGTYILFKNFSVNTQIEPKYRKNFVLENISKQLQELNYKPIFETTSSYVEKGGKYENFFVEGEKVYSHFYYGER